jgi:hypothetical protein
MPVPPAELTAHFTIAGPEDARRAALEAAAELALDAGPGELALSGARDAVLGALDAAVVAALDAGAHRLDVRLEAPQESRG